MIIHLVSHYVPHMGWSTYPWYDITFVSKGEVMCGAFGCENWILTCIHLAASNVYIAMSVTIKTLITDEPGIDILRTFIDDGEAFNILFIWNNVYMLDPFSGILLGMDLTPIDEWLHLRGALADTGFNEYLQALVEWI